METIDYTDQKQWNPAFFNFQGRDCVAKSVMKSMGFIENYNAEEKDDSIVQNEEMTADPDGLFN
ncbi:MAG TPA: hypothetical protein VK528_05515 [Flavobacterium sp.]|nr:hypothetical protein [Flavobacterium sp.]